MIKNKKEDSEDNKLLKRKIDGIRAYTLIAEGKEELDNTKADLICCMVKG
jgi:hypothetical protein